MTRPSITTDTPRDRLYRPSPPLRPKGYWLHNRRRPWYQSIFAYLVPLAILALVAAYYYAG